MEGNESSPMTVRIRGADNFRSTFSGLLPDTRYVVEVAGENSVSVGVYGLLIVSTPQSWWYMYCMCVSAVGGVHSVQS